MKIKNAMMLVVLLVAGLLSCSEGKKSVSVQAPSAETQTPAQQLPAFVMTDVNGKTVDLASFKGKKVFVNLWATWCPPCREEIPSIEYLYGKTNSENAVFVMLSLDENFDLPKKYATENKMKVPVYFPASPLPALFNTGGIPVTLIFDETGKLIKQNERSEDYGTAEYITLMNGR